MTRLPQFVAFKSMANKMYLRHRPENRTLEFSGNEVVSPYTKYEIKTAQSDINLVHIRCCHNDKYWATYSSTDNKIVAEADETDEDQSKWSCTLFEPLFDAHHQAYRLRHVKLGYYLGDNSEYSLFAGSNRQGHLMTTLDYGSIFVLPKFVAFRGDNDLFLRAYQKNWSNYLKFSGKEIADLKVGNEVFINADGSVRIKSNHYNKFWKRSKIWIWGNSKDTSSNNKNTLFWPVKVDNNTIALRNLGNGCYCKRFAVNDCLNAGVPTIGNEARLKVEELLLSRKIYDIHFRLSEAKISDLGIETITFDNAINNGTVNIDTDFTLSYKLTKTSSWSTSSTTKHGGKISIKSGIPNIVEGRIQICDELCESYTWGDTKSSESDSGRRVRVSTPSNTRTEVRIIATKGHCNVPFSYTQRDMRIDGEIVITRVDDGIFTGANYFNVHLKVDETPL